MLTSSYESVKRPGVHFSARLAPEREIKLSDLHQESKLTHKENLNILTTRDVLTHPPLGTFSAKFSGQSVKHNPVLDCRSIVAF